MSSGKLQILDIVIVVALYFFGCLVGKLAMEHFGSSWIAFNGPAIGLLAVGELIWFFVRKRLIKRWDRKSTKSIINT